MCVQQFKDGEKKQNIVGTEKLRVGLSLARCQASTVTQKVAQQLWGAINVKLTDIRSADGLTKRYALRFENEFFTNLAQVIGIVFAFSQNRHFENDEVCFVNC